MHEGLWQPCMEGGDTVHPLLGLISQHRAGVCQHHVRPPRLLLPGTAADTVPTHLPEGREAVVQGRLVPGVHQPVVSPVEWGRASGRTPSHVPLLGHTTCVSRPPPADAAPVTPSLSPTRGCYQGVLQLWVRVM